MSVTLVKRGDGRGGVKDCKSDVIFEDPFSHNYCEGIENNAELQYHDC
jgi:hypothetical protein